MRDAVDEAEGDVSTEQPPGSAATVDTLTPAGVEDKKKLGNDRFREGKFEDAIICYGEALALLEGGHNPAMRSTILSNQAMCLLKLDRFKDAEAAAGMALAADAANGKAVYRRGLARLQLADVRGALEDFQKASRLEPQNREVRLKLDEARKAVESTPVSEQEVAVATGAANALGMEKRGLYDEKPDLNEGRLAGTHREQREWISSISNWEEITDITWAEDDMKSQISVYLAVPGVHEIPVNKVCVWMTANSLEVRVVDVRDSNRFYMAKELWGQIDSDASSWKVRKDKISLKLQKRASARSWDRWEKLRRI
jgi:tetratricopeptide (TPR) repeat protein